jgi:hypothetical protein
MNQYKTCSKCRQEKTLESFSRHNGEKSAKSGYRSTCKSCDVQYNREYRNRNREKVNARRREWGKKNPISKKESDRKYRENNPERIRENHKTWRERNAEHVAEYRRLYLSVHGERKKQLDREYGRANRQKNNDAARRYRLKNPEKVREMHRKQELKHPDRGRMKQSRRRALLRENGVFLVTQKDVARMLNKPCAYCGGKSVHIDHVIPLAKGGVHGVGNLVGACGRCNLKKSSKFLSVWKAGK